MCLQNANNAALEMVGSKLASLRSARNEADYNLKSRQFQSKSMAEAQIANADEIIAAVAGKHAD